jgi:tetratricopeptide (TPR) repeat protein
MNRTKIIQSLIDKINAKSYLEIGIDNAENFKTISCSKKVSVDPNTDTVAMHHLTSDDYFKTNTDTFDVIFIDGLHHADQVYRDIVNSLSILNDGGYIVCHDMNPLQEEHQTIPFVSGLWNGDCWKAFVQLRSERSDLQMHVIDTDHGCGVISRGSQQPLDLMNLPLEYKFFNVNRRNWLNLISPAEFSRLYLNQDIPTIDSMLNEFVETPNDPETNFSLARYYHEIGQTASAVSYYIRTAERTDDLFLRYESLLHAANCFERQGTRRFTVKGILQQAITIMPKRPEAYYLLSKLYEYNESNEGRYLDSYMMCSIALQVCDFDNMKSFRHSVDYPGKYAIMFQKATMGWWNGLQEETKNIMLDLYTNYEMSESFYTTVRNNLINMGAFASKQLTHYTKDKFHNMKVKFANLDKIEQNYSEAYQDMFVLSIMDGKTNGSYLEIGSGHPSYGNNTYLLEKQFGWNGISIDLSEEFIGLHKNERSHHALLKDATLINYDALLTTMDMPKVIDYLQVDVDPADVSLNVLYSIPFEKYKFRVITFEHDYYTDPKSTVREKARKFLTSHGYILVVPNISPDDNRPYEDWFVNPNETDMNMVSRFISNSQETKNAEKFMMGAYNE